MLIEHCLENKINNPCRNVLSTKVMLITKNVLIHILSYGKESILINNESLLKLPLDFFSYKYFCSFAYLLLMTMKMKFN